VTAARPAGEAGLPTFFIIGAQKAGTSTLHRLLQQHPEAFMCDPKEPHFFSDQQQWKRGVEAYRALFAGAGTARAVGEASTTYAMYPHYSDVVARLTATVPEPRLVYIIREPIARMRSAYLHALAGGSETRPIGVALRADPRYLLTSSYALQLEQWLARVPRQRILLLSLEQLRDAPDVVLPHLFDFLDLDPGWRPVQMPPANPSAGKRPPRRWWRGIGAAALRWKLTERVPNWAVRLNESGSPLVRRRVEDNELAVTDDLRHEIERALAADRDRLIGHWGAGDRPGWLQDDASTALRTSTST
jgi:hypothetical protein